MTENESAGDISRPPPDKESTDVPEQCQKVLPDTGVDAIASSIAGAIRPIEFKIAPTTFRYSILDDVFRDTFAGVRIDTSSWLPKLSDARRINITYPSPPRISSQPGNERDAAALRADQAEIKADFLIGIIKTMAESSPATFLRAVADAIESSEEWRSHPRVRGAVQALIEAATTSPTDQTASRSGSDD